MCDGSSGIGTPQLTELRGRLTDVLIGNIDGKDYSDLMRAISELAELPEPLDYGRVPAAV